MKSVYVALKRGVMVRDIVGIWDTPEEAAIEGRRARDEDCDAWYDYAVVEIPLGQPMPRYPEGNTSEIGHIEEPDVLIDLGTKDSPL